MENKAIYSNILIVRNTEFLDEPLLVAQSTQRCHKPTISIAALSHIISSRAVNVKLGLIKDVNSSLRTLRLEVVPRGFVIFDADVVE